MAAAILAAVEGGFQPPGKNRGHTGELGFTQRALVCQRFFRRAGSPDSTAGKMPAATLKKPLRWFEYFLQPFSRSNIMKPVLSQNMLRVGLLVCAFGLSGCVISVGSRIQTPPPSPPTVVVTDPGDAATVAEIDAAAHLNMDSSRTQSLSQIAERPNLPAPVQVHLINTSYRCLSMESSKVAVLQKLIARQDFCDATRHAIVSQLSLLSFESSKQDLLNRINQRLAVNAQH